MPLVKVDRLIRREHALLDAEDECYFLGEYTARKGFAYSDTNQLIYNFKKSVERRGCSDYAYKMRAIRTVASMFKQALAPNAADEVALKAYTLVPIPPSKSKDDPFYDDRVRQMLDLMGAGLGLDIRDILVAKQTIRASHVASARPSIAEIYNNLRVDESLVGTTPTSVVLFDDTLVSGAHFKAAQRRLSERFNNVPITGMFVARRRLDDAEILV